MLTRATVPLGLPQAPRIPVCSLSAPAHDNILLMRITWNGWALAKVSSQHLQGNELHAPDPHVETILSGNLDKVLVCANTSSLERLVSSHHQPNPISCLGRSRLTYFRRKLFILVGDQVNAERELINTRALTSQIKDTNLGIGDTTVEAGLGVRLVYGTMISICPSPFVPEKTHSCSSGNSGRVCGPSCRILYC
jgi:hypothetical protein